MNARLSLCILACLVAPNLPAQSGEPSVDSARVARELWAAAVRGSRAGESRIALARATRAARAWPTQPAYWTGMARLAAQEGDVAALTEALDALAAMQLGQPLVLDTLVRRVAPAAVLERLRIASADVAGGAIAATIADTTVFAEGVDVDPATGTFYVGSVRQRTVLEVDASGRVRDLALARWPSVGGVFGVRVARDGLTLWVTTSGVPQMRGYQAADSAIAFLLQVRRADGRILRRISVPADARGHVLGDLAIGPAGDVFVTDSKAPWLYRLRPGADTVERTTHALFRSLQGAAPTPDGRALYVADYSHGLIRIELASGRVTRLADAPGSTSLGIDGIVLVDGAIVGVQNGVEPARVMRFTLDAAGETIAQAERLDQRREADEPTIGTVWRGQFIYVGTSQWEKYDDDGARKPGVALGVTRLFSVPLAPGAPRPAQRAPGASR